MLNKYPSYPQMLKIAKQSQYWRILAFSCNWDKHMSPDSVGSTAANTKWSEN